MRDYHTSPRDMQSELVQTPSRQRQRENVLELTLLRGNPSRSDSERGEKPELHTRTYDTAIYIREHAPNGEHQLPQKVQRTRLVSACVRRSTRALDGFIGYRVVRIVCAVTYDAGIA